MIANHLLVVLVLIQGTLICYKRLVEIYLDIGQLIKFVAFKAIMEHHLTALMEQEQLELI
jgi:hypothetical protein